MSKGRPLFPKGKDRWYVSARSEGRLCPMCKEPMSKSDWKSRHERDGLCFPCWMREENMVPITHPFKLGGS